MEDKSNQGPKPWNIPQPKHHQTTEQQNTESQHKIAVAIEYDKSISPAPRVTAAGQGFVADQIVEKAREAGVPIQSNPDLAAVLSKLNLGQEIPQELYQIVAEILAFVYTLDSKWEKEK